MMGQLDRGVLIHFISPLAPGGLETQLVNGIKIIFN